MFTGIIETLGQVSAIVRDQTNVHLFVDSSLAEHLKIDQSLAHNGVCLTVVGIQGQTHQVTAIEETLEKSAIGDLQVGDWVNLERCTKTDGRFDGHIVQGHVDQVATCVEKKDLEGSWLFTFEYATNTQNITVEKGSITVNGISLTVVDSQANRFSVAIIPYTIENTNLKQVEIGSRVNLEFDIIGKYVAKLLSLRA